MNNNPHDNNNDDTLGHGIHRLLRSQPDRVAPASLEARVLAEVARRAALPWWRQPFARWPLAARAAFMVVSAAIAAVMIVTLARILNVIPGRLETGAGGLLLRLQGYWNIVSGYCAYRLAEIPPHVFAIAAAVLASCYAALLGLGAAAYRYLWKTQNPPTISHT